MNLQRKFAHVIFKYNKLKLECNPVCLTCNGGSASDCLTEIPGTCRLDNDCKDGKCIINSIQRRVCDCQGSLNSGENCEVTPA
jgi:hypothetical protein